MTITINKKLKIYKINNKSIKLEFHEDQRLAQRKNAKYKHVRKLRIKLQSDISKIPEEI